MRLALWLVFPERMRMQPGTVERSTSRQGTDVPSPIRMAVIASQATRNRLSGVAPAAMNRVDLGRLEPRLDLPLRARREELEGSVAEPRILYPARVRRSETTLGDATTPRSG